MTRKFRISTGSMIKTLGLVFVEPVEVHPPPKNHILKELRPIGMILGVI